MGKAKLISKETLYDMNKEKVYIVNKLTNEGKWFIVDLDITAVIEINSKNHIHFDSDDYLFDNYYVYNKN